MAGEPNLIILTDIGGDPDDQQSLVRLLVTSNEFNIKAIIPMSFSDLAISSSQQMELVRCYINAYGQVYSSLSQHASGFPSPSYLLSILKRGATGIPATSGSGANVENKIIGAGKDTEGSAFIIEIVDNTSGTINIAIWGGAVDIAQALWKVKNSRSSSAVDQFISKIRIHAINDQDDAGYWIRSNFPNLFFILSKARSGDLLYSVFRGMYIGGDENLTSKSWVTSHVVNNHGALGALYPTITYTQSNPHGCLKEGDTPSWFFFLENGLNKATSPHYGGWGGRFDRNGTFYQDVSDHVGSTTDGRATVWRWRQDYQNEFQARMDWCVNTYSHANHKPIAQISGDLNRTVSGGALVALDASSSSDPDGNSLSYYWYLYPEPGSFSGSFSIPNSSNSLVQFYAPAVSSNRTMHIILEVRDNGNPNLVSYQRVVLTIQPGTSPPPSESITAPGAPSGPSTGQIGQNLNYSTSGSASTLEHEIEYQFNWGDGNFSSWGSATQSHSYSSTGSFSIQAHARCKIHTDILSN